MKVEVRGIVEDILMSKYSSGRRLKFNFECNNESTWWADLRNESVFGELGNWFDGNTKWKLGPSNKL